MSDWLDRYRNGEYVRVWSELLALGPAIREEPLYSGALAVAQETMSRAKRNVQILVDRLTAMGYQFGIYPDGSPFPDYEGPLSGPAPEAGKQLTTLESVVGQVPLSLHVWWETVGSVNLIGCHRDFPALSDPLVVFPPEAALEGFDDWGKPHEEDEWARPGVFFVPLAPDDLHKDNISGGEPYSIRLPNAAIDAALEFERHETTFVDYLRICFRWGGFPGLERAKEQFTLLEVLNRGLLPL